VTVATLPEALAGWARETPDARALSHGEEELCYRDLAALVDDLASRLAGAGVQAGDRVALLAGNHADWVVAFLASLRAGAIATPLNVRLGRLELERQLALCEPRVVLADEERAAKAGARALRVERGLGVWRAPRADLSSPPPPGAPALISFTSGTTGTPRGATITHDALVRSARAYVDLLGTGPGETTTVLVPLFHNTGFVDGIAHLLVCGGAVDVPGDFSTDRALGALERRPASFLVAVPGIVRLLALHERADDAFRSCRTFGYGGATTPPAWRAELEARWPHLRLYDLYGLTEFTSLTHALRPEDAASRPASVGRPVPSVRQRAVDGELWLAGPMRMLGYWHAERETRAALSGEWLRTGDLAEIDEDGFVTLQGRRAEVINRSGEKIHPVQVEAALADMPAVAEAAVVGAPHPIFGERVVACLTLRPGADLDEAAVRAALGDAVADYAIPERFLVVPELPRNAAGKVDRAQVRQLVAAEEDR
jgi:acyl-CoA synthetase (AMP-forming)/AMP-acid ligase II